MLRHKASDLPVPRVELRRIAPTQKVRHNRVVLGARKNQSHAGRDAFFRDLEPIDGLLLAACGLGQLR